MKQGSAHDITAAKREPIAHKQNVESVAQLGVELAVKKKPLVAGRGYEAPKDEACTYHKSGSQGRH